MFPLLKRATAIGICNFVCRAFTIFAPLAAELEKPLPLLCLLVVNMTALLVSLTFPSRQEELNRHAQILKDVEVAQMDFTESVHSKRALSEKGKSGVVSGNVSAIDPNLLNQSGAFGYLDDDNEPFINPLEDD